MKYAVHLIKGALLFTLAYLSLASATAQAAPAAQLDDYWLPSNPNSTTPINHEQWQNVLNDYLITDHTSGINRVDYQRLKEDAASTLAGYIAGLTALDPREYNRDEQFAYWVNLYNALTVQLIIDNYPVSSITRLGNGLFAFGPWDDPITAIAGKTLTLNDIEHRILRPIWRDYRIHFAVNCASLGCPNLLREAFTGENFDVLLDQAAHAYLAHPRGLQFRGDKLVLSSIFKWYAEDFGANKQAVLATLSQYLPADLGQQVANYEGKIRYRYDWSLNDR